jgi:hypothetical protein
MLICAMVKTAVGTIWFQPLTMNIFSILLRTIFVFPFVSLKKILFKSGIAT